MRTVVPDYLPCIQIRYSCAIEYHLSIGWLNASRNNKENQRYLRTSTKYSGKMTIGAKKRIAKAVCKLLLISPPRTFFNPVRNIYQTMSINFLTLTIPLQAGVELNHKECYTNMLKPLIEWLKGTCKIKSYIWKAELQESGQLHYHITTNKFIHYRELRNKWNKLLAENNHLIKYFKEHGNVDANSTDIHAVEKLKDIENYLMKYVSKDASRDDLKIDGKVWDCSNDLKGFSYFKVEDYSAETEANIRKLNPIHIRRIEAPNKYGFDEWKCNVIKLSRERLHTILSPEETAQYQLFLHSLNQ